MMQFARVAVVVVLSSLGALLVVNYVRPIDRVNSFLGRPDEHYNSQGYDRIWPGAQQHPSSIGSYPPSYQGSGPGRYSSSGPSRSSYFISGKHASHEQVPSKQWYPKSRNLGGPLRGGHGGLGGFYDTQPYQPVSAQTTVRHNPALVRPFNVPRDWNTRGWVNRAEGQDCRSNPMTCGEGFFCCRGTCRTAKKVQIEFAADDRGELWLCDWNARSTNSYTQSANYDGPVPCGVDLYVKATNTNLEGGAAIGVQSEDGTMVGSGTTLAVTSQTDFSGSFDNAAKFTALDGTFPYTSLISKFGAYPVKDASNPRAGVTNFRFQAC